jgi:hypothetical protein
MRKGTKLFLYSAFDKVPPQIIEFEGIQRVGFDGIPDFGIYNITVSLKDHPAGSTLSRQTLEEGYGYVFPLIAI